MVPSVIQNKTWGQREPDGGMSEDEAAQQGESFGNTKSGNKWLSRVYTSYSLMFFYFYCSDG